MHDEDVVAAAGHVLDRDAGNALDEIDDLRLDAVDHVDLSALQRGGARGGVVDHDDLDLVGEAHLVAHPVVGEALAALADTGLVDRDLVGAGRDAGIGRVLAATRLDDQVIVGHQIGKVGIRFLERHDDILAVDLHRFDALHDAERAGLRFLVRVALERLQHVVGGHRLAVVELDAVADLEGPLLGVVRRADLLGDPVLKAAFRRQRNEIFAPALAEGEWYLAEEARRVEAVGGLAALHARLDDAALHGTGSLCGAREEGIREGSGDAERGGASQEVAAAQFAGYDAAAQIIEFV